MTLQDRYVNYLAAANDARNAEIAKQKKKAQQAAVQAEYDAWKQKQDVLDAQRQPEAVNIKYDAPYANDDAAVKAMRTKANADAITAFAQQAKEADRQQAAAKEAKKNDTKVYMDENGNVDVDSVKKNARAKYQAGHVKKADPVYDAPYANDKAARQANRTNANADDITAYINKARKNEKNEVRMNSDGTVDVASVKRDARAKARTAQKNDTPTIPVLGNISNTQGTQAINRALSNTGRTNRADNPMLSVNTPFAEQATRQQIAAQKEYEQAVKEYEEALKTADANSKIHYYADKWLDPAYTMTEQDKKDYADMVEQWRAENPEGAAAWDNNFDGEVYHWDFLNDYPEVRDLMDIAQKDDALAAYANGMRGAFNFFHGLAKEGVKKFTDDETDAKIDEAYARRKRQIENAKAQNNIAYGLGNFYGQMMQYGPWSALGKKLGIGVAKEGAKLIPFLQDQAWQNAGDAIVQTAPLVQSDIENGVDAGTTAKHAGLNMLDNALQNLAIDLGSMGLEAHGAAKAAKATKQADELKAEAEQLQKEAAEMRAKAAENELTAEQMIARRQAEEAAATMDQNEVLARALEEQRAAEMRAARQAEEAAAQPTDYRDMLTKALEEKAVYDANVGYHAGDLGKAEWLGNQTGNRGTGHYGTGTYFVGDKNALDLGGYKDRPIEEINFSNYNMYRPTDYQQGMDLHNYLKGVNENYLYADNIPKSEREWTVLRDYVAQKQYDDPVELYNDLTRLYDNKTIEDNVKSYMGRLYEGKPLVRDESLEALDDDLFSIVSDEERAELTRLVNDFDERKFDKYVDSLNKKYRAEKYAKEQEYNEKWAKSEPRYTMTSSGTWYDHLTDKELDPYEFAQSVDMEKLKANLIDLDKPGASRNRYMDWNSELEEKTKALFGVDSEQARQIIRDVRDEIQKADYNYYDQFHTADSASTRFMKRLGYEGVDTRGIKDLDNTEYGSVIYDLKGKDLEQQAAAMARRKAKAEAEQAAKAAEEAKKAASLKESTRNVERDLTYKNPATGEMDVTGNAFMRRMNDLTDGLPEDVKKSMDRDAYSKAINNFIDEAEKANAGQTNKMHAAAYELEKVIDAASEKAGSPFRAGKTLDEMYNLSMTDELPKKFNGEVPAETNPILKNLDEKSEQLLRGALEERRFDIENTLYKNYDKIMSDPVLKQKVQDVMDAYDKWYDAVMTGAGDTGRLGKDVRNAMIRANRAMEKEGLKGFSVSQRSSQQFNAPDRILKAHSETSNLTEGEIERLFNNETKQAPDAITSVKPTEEIKKPTKTVAADKGKDEYRMTISEKQIKKAKEKIDSVKPVNEKPENIESVKSEPKVEKPVKANEPTSQKLDKVEPPKDMVEDSFSKNVRKGKHGVDKRTRRKVAKNPSMHEVAHNVDTSASVDDIMKEGLESAHEKWLDMKGENDVRFAPLGVEVARGLGKQGKYKAAADILDEVSQELTRAGQMTQAAWITMLKDDPMVALECVQKEIRKLNKDGAEQFGKKWKELKLTDDELKRFNELKRFDRDGMKSLIDDISERLGREAPSSLLEKLLELRRVNMLFNSRTLLRNVAANIPTALMRWSSDRLAALGERAYKHLVNPDYDVTQSLHGSAGARKLAEEAFNTERVQNILKDTPSKAEIPQIGKSMIQHKTIFKGTRLEKFLERNGVNLEGFYEAVSKGLPGKNRVGKKGIHSFKEAERQALYNLLDAGDSPFFKEAFRDRLGSYINAKGIKTLDEIPDEAYEIAINEALKATYKDNSWAVKMLQGMRGGMMHMGKPGKILANATIPFVQAPGNIAARMVDYSVLGGANGVRNIIKGTKSGDMKLVREGIDQLSKGLTGTGMVVAGIALHNAGIITGAYSKDKDQRNFQKQTGFREYSWHIGDMYFPYEFAQPSAEPLIIGTLLAEAINNSDQFDSDVLRALGMEGTTAGKVIGATKEGARASVNSWFNESPMQGLAELLKGKNGDYESNIAGNIWDVGVANFGSSFIPSWMNALAKTVDPSQRQTKDNDNSARTFLNEQIAKIPGASEKLPAKYDTWGRPMTYGDTVGHAFLNRFILPSDTTTDKHDKVDDEITRLYNATKNVAVFPQTAPTSYNGEKLTAQQYSHYQMDMGQRSRKMVEALMKSDAYKDMSDDEKVKALSEIYTASKNLTEHDMYNRSLSGKVVEAYKSGKEKAVVKYYTGTHAMEKAGLEGGDKIREYVTDSKDPNKTARDLAKCEDILKKNHVIKYTENISSKYLDIYDANGVQGVEDYCTIDKNKKGASYNGYQSMKQYIPSLTAAEFSRIYNTYSVKTDKGNYNSTFAKEDELIPYLKSRTWSSNSQLNNVAHVLSPSVEGTWSIEGNRLKYVSPKGKVTWY